ncbi:DUF1145 domain-containing protein [Pseudomonas donghuensis]|uniref:DUF1145 domain-containing protein n=1 Tax=Pseudomonas donghuensis TaxID=1163398 RepID=UPI00215EBD17|nr:DUF1145 domain-containing protein [Pseudomonas donghuensis]UVL28390.1 DUF1145 domain-containing protein [Pseudomonas donghuensis]
MQGLLGLAKALAVVFWWVVLVNLLIPLEHPFHLLINAAGAALLGLHLLEVLMFNGCLRTRSHRWFDRLQILLVGIFHVLSIPAPRKEAAHA